MVPTPLPRLAFDLTVSPEAESLLMKCGEEIVELRGTSPGSVNGFFERLPSHVDGANLPNVMPLADRALRRPASSPPGK